MDKLIHVHTGHVNKLINKQCTYTYCACESTVCEQQAEKKRQNYFNGCVFNSPGQFGLVLKAFL